jgi:hypothetical protein
VPRRKGKITPPNKRKGWKLRARGRAKETTERSGFGFTDQGIRGPGSPPPALRERG